MPVLLSGADAQDLGDYAAYLERVGDGTEPTVPGKPNTICIPASILAPTNNVGDLVAKIYHNISHNITNPDFMAQRSILTTTNDMVDTINSMIQSMLGTQVKLCHLGQHASTCTLAIVSCHDRASLYRSLPYQAAPLKTYACLLAVDYIQER